MMIMIIIIIIIIIDVIINMYMYGETKVSALFRGKKHTWIIYCAAF